ncbi:MAG: hypothetical protein ACI9LV_000353 [Candidatus Nanohaloarchaea archaeon]|jgi:hypothetical protein
MTLNTAETVKSALGNLTTQLGASLVAVIFFLQVTSTLAGNMTGTGLTGTAGTLLSLILFGATVVVALGALRSFESGELEKTHFTENLAIPILRLGGANIVITAFAVLAFAPLGALSSAIGGTGIAEAGAAALIISLTGITVSFAAFFYAVLALCLSLPEIAVKDRRMFKALDSSVQRTRGHKKQMMLALTPVILLYTVSLLVNLGTAGNGLASNPVIIIFTGFLGAVTAVTVYSTLIEFHQRIGEEDGNKEDGFF